MTSAPRTHVRRERGVAESLLSVVLVLEAAVLFFATLAIMGLRGSTALADVPAGWILGGGAAFMVLLVVVALLQRYPWGIVLGGVLQVPYVALGVLHPFMFLIGAVFAGMWIWCLVRARRIESSRRAAAEGVES